MRAYIVIAALGAVMVSLVARDAVGGVPTLAERCAAAKLKLAAKKAAGWVACYAKATQQGRAVDQQCLAKVNSRFGLFFGKIEQKGGCFTSGDQAMVSSKAEQCATNLACSLPAQCCDAQEVVVATDAPGTVQVGNIGPFPFPAGGLSATLDVAAATDTTCRHDAVVTVFNSQPICIQGTTYTTRLVGTGCASGGMKGRATVWDGFSCCPDADVNKSGDTSDGTCNPSGSPCTLNPGGAAANTLGNVDTVRGDGVCDPPGLHVLADIPVRAQTWSSPSGCPDPDQTFTPGTDTLIAEFNFILSATTGTATAAFIDKNNDGCSFVGLGPSGPVTQNGAPGLGPCCNVGDHIKLVSAGPVFGGVNPFGDLIFQSSVPTAINACNPLGGSIGSCTLDTAGGCLD